MTVNLLYIYLAALAFGGVFLVASLISGTDGGGEPGTDGAGEPGSADGDAGLAADQAAAGDVSGSGLAGIWLPFGSMRFWVFFLTFFGITGATLTGLSLASTWPTLVAALSMGAITGWAAAATLRKLDQQVIGGVIGAADFRGQEGRVLLSLSGGSPGKVRLTVKGQDIDLPARNAEGQDLEAGCSVLVIDYSDNALIVVPMPGGKG